jgi:adenylate cyclase
MSNKTPDPQRSSLMIDGIADWLMECALDEQTTMMALFDGTCLRLLAEGLPIVRAHIAFRTLHPLFSAISHTWHKDRDTERLEIAHGSSGASTDFHVSPYAFLIENDIDHVRRRLTGDNSLLDFPILKEFHENYGATDYLAFSIPFDHEAKGERLRSGVIGSWMTDRPGGFTDGDLHALLRIQTRLAVTFKVLIKSQIADNILNTYLGPDAGRQVLSGQIQRGDYEAIHSVIWYSDMRNSTPLAETLSPEEFFAMVNAYFECTAGAVMDSGGEVLRFIGDAVLAIFPIRKGKLTVKQACTKAMRAMREAERRVSRLNAKRTANGLPLVEYGLGLHVGDVLYGNIGVPERLEFSVIGPAANETARLESLTKEIGHRVIASEKFARNIKGDWVALGKKNLKGVGGPMKLFSPRELKPKAVKKKKAVRQN